jgi:hypothetical protein
VTARVPEGYLPIAAVDVPRIRAGAVEGCTRFGAGFFAACIRAGLMPQRLDDRPVRVINLRRRAASTIAGQSDREYHHQWIVRGHWRDQWYASRGVHRPVWIAPHVKGPEGAPMLGGEKVHAWTG